MQFVRTYVRWWCREEESRERANIGRIVVIGIARRMMAHQISPRQEAAGLVSATCIRADDSRQPAHSRRGSTSFVTLRDREV